MTMNDDWGAIVDLILSDEPDEAQHHLLVENEEEQILKAMGGEKMPMNYLLKFEEYLDEHDIYLFDGWEEAQIVGKPQVDKFWCTFYVFCAKGTDLRGALRVKNEKEGQNQVKAKKAEGGHIIKFKILKRYLDQVEQHNKQKAKQMSQDEVERIG